MESWGSHPSGTPDFFCVVMCVDACVPVWYVVVVVMIGGVGEEVRGGEDVKFRFLKKWLVLTPVKLQTKLLPSTFLPGERLEVSKEQLCLIISFASLGSGVIRRGWLRWGQPPHRQPGRTRRNGFWDVSAGPTPLPAAGSLPRRLV